jgi:hypothetical protein
MAKTAAPKNDAYVGLLAISFCALLGASVLMALDASDLGEAPAPAKVNVPGGSVGRATEAPKGNPTPAPVDPMPKDMSRVEPAALPAIVVPADKLGTVVPVKAEELPPLAVSPFEIPKQ